MTPELLTDFHAETVGEGFDDATQELVSMFSWNSGVLGVRVDVPAGFQFEESVPWPLRRWGFTRRSGAGHDWLYRKGGYYLPVVDGKSIFVPVNRKQADACYLELALLSIALYRSKLAELDLMTERKPNRREKLNRWLAVSIGSTVVRLRYHVLRIVGWKAWNENRAKSLRES